LDTLPDQEQFSKISFGPVPIDNHHRIESGSCLIIDVRLAQVVFGLVIVGHVIHTPMAVTGLTFCIAVLRGTGHGPGNQPMP